MATLPHGTPSSLSCPVCARHITCLAPVLQYLPLTLHPEILEVPGLVGLESQLYLLLKPITSWFPKSWYYTWVTSHIFLILRFLRGPLFFFPSSSITWNYPRHQAYSNNVDSQMERKWVADPFNLHYHRGCFRLCQWKDSSRLLGRGIE